VKLDRRGLARLAYEAYEEQDRGCFSWGELSEKMRNGFGAFAAVVSNEVVAQCREEFGVSRARVEFADAWALMFQELCRKLCTEETVTITRREYDKLKARPESNWQAQQNWCAGQNQQLGPQYYGITTTPGKR
jgi:hypothetical protein